MQYKKVGKPVHWLTILYGQVLKHCRQTTHKWVLRCAQASGKLPSAKATGNLIICEPVMRNAGARKKRARRQKLINKTKRIGIQNGR